MTRFATTIAITIALATPSGAALAGSMPAKPVATTTTAATSTQAEAENDGAETRIDVRRVSNALMRVGFRG